MTRLSRSGLHKILMTGAALSAAALLALGGRERARAELAVKSCAP